MLALFWAGCATEAKTAPDPSSAGGAEAGLGVSADAATPGEPSESSSSEASAAIDSSAAEGGATSGLALSDGFEGAAAGSPPDPSLWTVGSVDCSGAGKLAVDGSQAHSGTHSVRVDGGGGYCDHVFFATSAAVAQVSPQLYARFFVRLGAPLGAGHTTFLAMKDQADGGKDMRMGGQDSVLIYNRQSDDATLPTLSPAGIAASMAPAATTWTCIELYVDETAGTIETWVDGKQIAGLSENGTPVADISTQWLAHAWKPMLVDFRLGWESYAGQTMTLWFDDVAIAGARIGCGV
jgi:hypothetical protein